MELDIKVLSDIFQQVGAGNAALIIILFLFSWGFIRIIKVLPRLVERLVCAIENLGTTFAVHDTRATVIAQGIVTLQSSIHELSKEMATQSDIIRLHKRLDDHNITAATKEDINQVLKAMADHSRDCQDRTNQIQRDVLK